MSFRLRGDLRAAAQCLADQQGISLSEYARSALEDRLQRENPAVITEADAARAADVLEAGDVEIDETRRALPAPGLTRRALCWVGTFCLALGEG